MSEYRNFLGLALLTVGLYVACFALWQVGDIVWTDFIQSNPNRTHSDSWTLIALSPLYGVFLTTAVAPLPVIVGLTALKIASKFRQPIPHWLFAIAGLLCSAAFILQITSVFPILEDDTFGSAIRSSRVWIVAIATQIPFMMLCRWWLRQPRRPVAQPIIAE